MRLLPLVRLAAAALVAVLCPAGPTVAQSFPDGARYVVNDTGNEGDADVGDGLCQTVNGTCTLPAAVEQANATPDWDLVLVEAGVYELTQSLAPSGRLNLAGLDRDAVTISTQDPVQLVVPAFFADLTLEHLTLDGGTGDSGGSLDNRGATVTLNDVTARNGTATNRGGCFNLAAGATLTLTFSLVTGCSAPAGGAIASAGQLNLLRVEISGNSADSAAGVFVSGGGFDVRGTWFRDNLAQFITGGFEADFFGTPSLLLDSLFSGNAAIVGAAFQIAGGAQTTVANVTVAGNTATTLDAVSLAQGAQVAFNNVTLADNDPGNGADLAVVDADVVLTNSAVEHLFVDPTNGNVTLSEHNAFVENQDGNHTLGTGDEIVADLALLALDLYGGPLPVMLPLPGSPLVNTASSAAPGQPGAAEETDARGVPRQLAPGAPDRGAAEQVECEDGQDNDGDGDADANDSACKPRPVLSCGRCPVELESCQCNRRCAAGSVELLLLLPALLYLRRRR
jgi:hypothetical protein